MKKIIIRDQTFISPFNEPARDLRVMNKPLWLYQRDVLSPYCQEEVECSSLRSAMSLPADILADELIIYRDNLFFDEFLFKDFITAARNSGQPAQIAFSKDDEAIVTHALPLQDGIRLEGDFYVADLFYYPKGTATAQIAPKPVEINTEFREMGYYHIPTYMATEQGDLGFNVPLKAFLPMGPE
jgi:hypothetical protein